MTRGSGDGGGRGLGGDRKSNRPKFKAWYSLRVIPTLPGSVVCKCHRTQQSERLSFSVCGEDMTGHGGVQHFVVLVSTLGLTSVHE